MEKRPDRSSLGRRRFLGGSALAAAGMALGRSRLALADTEADPSDQFATLNTPNTFTGDNFFGSGRPWCDVRAFGATGDGSADDTQAVQSAIDSVGSRGGLILFPQGVYRVSAPLVVSSDFVTLRGIGRGSEVFAAPGWAGPAMIVSAGRKGIRIEDLWLDGQDGRAGLGIDMTPPPGIEAHNWIEGNHIAGFRSGIRIGAGGFGCHILRNTITTGGTLSGTTRGIDLQGPDNVVAFNRINNFQEAGIHLGSGGQQVMGNHVFAYARAVRATPYPTAIRLAGGGLQVIEGNYLDNVRQNATLLIQPVAGRPIHRVLINGNTFMTVSPMRDPGDSAAANYPVVQIDDRAAAVSGVVIDGNVGVATPDTPFAFILRQTPTVMQTAVTNNDVNECMGWWNRAPKRYGGNTISMGASYRRGLADARSGLVLKTKAGRISDADFDQPPVDGTMAIDTRNGTLSVRIGKRWRTVRLA
ncbi:MAG TPA: glycosyl hydrolase family 28-related protein [Actinomycetota bacterium]|nr:glycosyl hydrolase family 28-related protein [Actinomycetota bacterium]